ncbi:hypothetical protein M9458_041164 [Cirrhinus mrigala]|uniref:Uncharacterized protein n=1 Tax=Cirrhinus mrigala TaxID=683832 RepID=A0ABD0NWR1_CIRMR
MDDIKKHNSPTLVTARRRSKQEQASVNSTVRENRADDCSWPEAEQEPEEDCELNEEEEEDEEEGLEEDEYWNEELQDDTVVDGQVPVDELANFIQVEEVRRYRSDVNLLYYHLPLEKMSMLRHHPSAAVFPNHPLTERFVFLRA